VKEYTHGIPYREVFCIECTTDVLILKCGVCPGAIDWFEGEPYRALSDHVIERQSDGAHAVTVKLHDRLYRVSFHAKESAA